VGKPPGLHAAQKLVDAGLDSELHEFHMVLPAVPHKAVAEVSKMKNL